METEARRNAQLPFSTVFEKKGSYSVVFLSQQSQPGFRSQDWFHTQSRCGVLVGWAPRAATGVGAGPRPTGIAGDAGGQWLRNEATRGAPRLPRGAAPAPWDVDSHLEVTPSPATSHGTLAVHLWALPTQPGPSCLSLLFLVSTYPTL